MIVVMSQPHGFAPVLRRVRPADIRRDTWAKPDALDTCLECWSAWMRRDDTDLSAKSQRTLKGDGDGYGSQDTSAARRDNEIALATDAMIAGLTSAHRWAIMRKMGLSTAWRFPSLDFMEVAHEALSILTQKLIANTATRMLF